MKRLVSILLLTFVIVMAAALPGRAAVMEDYCSAPPYVTRSIPPNIMILLDNSCDMLNAAHDHSEAYNNDTSTDTYTGYFIPDAYYYGGTQNRFQVVEQNLASTASYIRTSYLGFDIVFKGNFLNYISMSRFDLLSKILTGGNAAVPRQAGGASLVRSASGSACAGSSSSWNWTTTDYPGCIFVVDSGEFRIEDYSAGSCGLLTTLNIARAPSNTFFAWILKKLRLLDAYEILVAKLRGTVRFFARSLEKIDVATKVHAAGPYAVAFTTSSPLASGTQGSSSITRTIQATVSNGTTPYNLIFLLTSGGLPPGLTFDTMACTTPAASDPGSCSITFSGSPSTAGTYYFTLLVTATDSRAGNPRVATVTKEFMMTINAASAVNVNITTPTLPSGVVTTTFTNSTPVAIPDLQTVTSDIAVTHLPHADTVATLASVKINMNHSYDGDLEILLTSPSGTTIKLSDNRGGSGDNFTNTVFSRSAVASISTGTAPFTGTFIPDQPFTDLTGAANGTWRLTVADLVAVDSGILNNWTLAFNPNAATYSQTLSALASGGTGSYTYTWSVTSGSLPPGLQLNASTGEIYGAPTTAGSYIFTVEVSATDSAGVTGTTTRELTIVIGTSSGRRTTAYRLWVDVGRDYYNNSLPTELGTGLVQKYWAKAKWGITNFDQAGNNVRIKVNECIGANNMSTFLNSLDGAVPTNVQSAPLADAYYGVINYFQNLGQTTEWQGGCIDPFTNDNVSCRKNFILTLSSAYNVSNPGANFSQSEADCPTDYGNSGAKLVQNACYAYKNDQRTATVGASNVAGEQKLYHFAVYTFGADTEPAVDNNGVATSNGRLANKHVLEDAAKASSPIKRFYDASQGVDLQTQLMKAIDDILSQAASGTAVSVLTTSSRGIGSMVQAYFLPATLQETREIAWTGYLQNLWIDPTDNLREDTTHDAKLITASESRADGDKVVKLFFDTNTNETKAATFTTEDDGTGGTLSTCSAPASAIKPFNSVEYLWEAGKSLALRSPSGPSGRTIFTSKVVTRVTSTGTTITTLDGTANPSSPVFSTGMTADMQAALNPDATYTADNIIKYIRGECLETTSPQAITGDCPGSSPTLNPLFRDRRLKVYSSPTSSVLADGANAYGNVWKLGDIISSTPKVLANTPLNTYHIDYGDNTYFQYISDTSGDNSYKKRSAISFVGANDGMVHAFRVGYLKDKGLAAGVKGLFKNFFNSGDTVHDRLGEEVWAYVPYNAFPYLKYLADPGYCHIYYNDLSVRLVDASLGCSIEDCNDPDDPREKASWHTVLIGGMRFGGACSGADASPAEPPTGTPANVGYSSYFAIDITDPENPLPLWEFSDDDMGYATTFASVIRTGGTGGPLSNGNWYVAIGSGSKQLPKSNVDIARTSTGHVYFLNLKTGELVKKMDLDHEGIVGDILSIDADKNFHSEKIYFGTAYNSSGWKGKLVAVDIPDQELNASWSPTIRYLFTGNNPFTASPDAARDTDGNVWVYAGSGKYYGDVDEAETAQQIFFGLKDKSSGITYPVSVSPLTAGFEDKTNVNTTGVVTGTSTVCTYDGTGFSNVNIVTSINRTSSVTSAPAVGWFVNLNTSPKVERVISRPLAVGGLVDFLTYEPSSSVCDYGGNSFLYSLGFTSGEAPASVAIRASAATGGVTSMGSTVTVVKRVPLGKGAPPSGEAIIVPPPKEDREALKKKIQVATGVIIEAENSPVTSVKSKIIHWLRK